MNIYDIDDDFKDIENMTEAELDRELLKNNINPEISIASLEGRLSGKIIPIKRIFNSDRLEIEAEEKAEAEKYHYAFQSIFLIFFKNYKNSKKNKYQAYKNNTIKYMTLSVFLLMTLVILPYSDTNFPNLVDNLIIEEESKISSKLFNIEQGDSIYSILENKTDAKNKKTFYRIPNRLYPKDKVTLTLFKSNIKSLKISREDGSESLYQIFGNSVVELMKVKTHIKTTLTINESLQASLYENSNIPDKIVKKISNNIRKKNPDIDFNNIPKGFKYAIRLKYFYDSNKMAYSEVNANLN